MGYNGPCVGISDRLVHAAGRRGALAVRGAARDIPDPRFRLHELLAPCLRPAVLMDAVFSGTLSLIAIGCELQRWHSLVRRIYQALSYCKIS